METRPPASGAPWSAILEVQDPDGTRTRHPFRHPRTAVGRARDNDLSLADDGISQRHCEFVAERGYFVVRDLGSQNGTFVNDRRQGEARLRDGDEIRIGKTRIRVALEGAVRRPERRRRWRGLGAVLGLLAAAAVWFWLGSTQAELRGRYAAALRAQAQDDACRAPPLDAVEAADAQLGGRSFALTVGKDGVRLSREDEALDRELSALYRRKLSLYREAYRALALAQEARRQSAEKLLRAGQRLWTVGGRKTASFVDGLLDERIEAGDQLLQSLKQLGDDTAQLTASVDALLGPRPDPQTVAHLKAFRFRTDLRAARAACEAVDGRVSAAIAGALAALAE